MAGAQSPQSRVLITRGNQPGYRGKFKKLENKKFSKNTSTCVLSRTFCLDWKRREDL
jgi:hypothetical protein